MYVNHAELLEIDERPALRLVIDDKEAWVFEPKRSLLDMGYVILVDGIGSQTRWADRLPRITVAADPSVGQAELVLSGATADPLVLALARGFWNLCNGHGQFGPRPINVAAIRARLKPSS
jgi:hypothetical protein